MRKKLCILYLFTAFALASADNPCNLRATDDGSVCVCDSTYCDTVPPTENLESGQYQLYTTSKEKLGFYSTIGTFSNNSSPDAVTITISDLNSIHQTIIGFGGAFTDATGINIASLPHAAQNQLLESYFGDDGIQYSIGRIPIGGTDFSIRAYTYVDEHDETLESFALQEEDTKYKIPYVQRAMQLRGNKPFNLFASAWTSPNWMKTNNASTGTGFLKDEYMQLWADYYIKFFDVYQENSIPFWGVTTQNEPIDGYINVSIPNQGFSQDQMKDWVAKYLGPTIRNSQHKDLKIILHDDQRLSLPLLNWFLLSDDDVIEYSDGIGIHYYTDKYIPASILNMAKSDKKDLFRLGTEACEGSLAAFGIEKPVVLGSWTRAEYYINSIMDDLKYDFIGWTDWNMALDVTGGPNFVDNKVDSPIIVNASFGEFYKQPMFYAMGHFSKFLVPDSVRVDVDETGSLDGILTVAFIRPDGKIAVIIKNSSDNDEIVNINILGSTEVFNIAQHSINTILYSI